ncbi:MAG: hypothetical protein WC802_04345 [Patescibacteria group bacterium]|jgi:hypothetical protein
MKITQLEQGDLFRVSRTMPILGVTTRMGKVIKGANLLAGTAYLVVRKVETTCLTGDRLEIEIMPINSPGQPVTVVDQNEVMIIKRFKGGFSWNNDFNVEFIEKWRPAFVR